MNKINRIVASFVFLFSVVLFAESVHAQGVTTASINGVVKDNSGDVLPAANVVAIHLPSGTTYGASTRTDGRFNIKGMRVGGPYRITASFIGFTEEVKNDIFLNLGQDLDVNFELSETVGELGEVVVTGIDDKVLNSERTGAATYIERATLEQLPTISRSTQDFTRLTPQSDGNSFGGRNVLFNNFSLDGSIFNNPFGLDSPVPGGQTNAQPVSLDAVDQIQVSLAPFDVTQGGFTGAGINTVTKSGTNEYEGSLYFFTRNENLIGDNVAGQSVLNPNLEYSQVGFRVGGPIIKNKLFFFVNAEFERRDDPGSNFIAAPGSTPNLNPNDGVSILTQSDINTIRNALSTQYGYETGPFQDYIHSTNNDKILAKIDWNINQDHTASFRFNLLDAVRDLPPNDFAITINNAGRFASENSLPSRNSGYAINNELTSYVAEVKSRFGNKASNFFLIGYTQFRDFREAFSTPFPTIEIENGQGGTLTTLGHEPFSINNILDQNVFQVTNNFTYYEGKHTLTAGVNFEVFDFDNSFNLFRFGVFPAPGDLDFDSDGIFERILDINGDGIGDVPGYRFSSLANFLQTVDPSNPNYRDYNAEVATYNQAPLNLAETTLGQLGLYIQDEYRFDNQLKVTLGLRIDVPMYFSDIDGNAALVAGQALPTSDPNYIQFQDGDGNPEFVDVGSFPDAQILWSPRLGFNYSFDEDRTTQLRGGTGIFTGRLPFVWIGNQVANQGINDINNVGIVNATVEDFKFPQVWKTNVALDYKLPFDILSTTEFIYSKDINAVFVRNANLGQATGTLSGGPDNRPTFNGAVLNDNVGAAYIIDNTDEGYAFSITEQLRKNWENGLYTTLAYTYGRQFDVITSTEISQFLFEGNAVSDSPNKPELANSAFGLQHRIIASLNYSKSLFDNTNTSVGLFFEFAQGGRFSYTYAGDLNGDGIGGNDLIYIPQTAADINLIDIPGGATAAEQWTALNAFIEQDDYLSENRGSISERNGALNEWFSTMDLRFAQDFYLDINGKRNTLQFTLDILNFGNFLNEDWGVRTIPLNRTPIAVAGFDGGGNPEFNYVGSEDSFTNDLNLFSRWRMQFGIRYIFN